MSQPKGQQEEFVETIEPELSRAAPPHNNTAGSQPKGDQALQLIEEAGHSNILTPENNAKVLRKIDLRLLPILLGIYFLQQLDKSTISYASVFGIVEKAHLHGQQYSWLGGSIYLAQLVFQPLVAYLLVKVPLAKFLAVSCLLWGIALTCMTAATNFGELLACRIFLGIFEAGIGSLSPDHTLLSLLTMGFISTGIHCSHSNVVPPSGAACEVEFLVCDERSREYGRFTPTLFSCHLS